MNGKLLGRLGEIAGGPGSRLERLRSICEALRDSVDHYDWVGVYVVSPGGGELELGPFSGQPTEHVRIPFGTGVCGRAAEEGRTLVVQDVASESNYLACSPSVRSEIVLPISRDGTLVGELDIDSHAPAPFTREDEELLEEACGIIATLL